MAALSLQHQAVVQTMLRRGDRDTAIAYVQTHAGCGASEANRVVAALDQGLSLPSAEPQDNRRRVEAASSRNNGPRKPGERLRPDNRPDSRPENRSSGGGLGLIVFLFFTGWFVYGFFDFQPFDFDFKSKQPGQTPAVKRDGEQEKLERMRQARKEAARQRAGAERSAATKPPSPPLSREPSKEMLTGTPRPPATCPRRKPYPAIADGTNLHKLFEVAYAEKLSNPNYAAWKNKNNSESGPQDFREEELIKTIRDHLALNQRMPPGETAVMVPTFAGDLPEIDGRLDAGEWRGATVFSIGGKAARTRLLLMADCHRLYIAADVPDDATQTGYDQLRFHYHLQLTAKLVNERLHVRGNNGPTRPTTIRQTTIRWTGSPSTGSDERWKKFNISDWSILNRAEGAASLSGHRQFEGALDLREAGLHVGVPFAARVEVESDPEHDPVKKTRKRQYLGKLGSDANPLWLTIGR